MRDAAPNLDARKRPTALVTRPRAEAEELAAALAKRDVEAIVEPLLDIAYRDTAPDLEGVQAVLCTSANGVRALARVTAARGVRLLAVGAATAARASAAGFTDVESAGGDVDDLVRLVCARQRPAAGRLLHVAGSVVAGDLAGRLRERGFRVDRAVLYDARPATALTGATATQLHAGGIDFLLLFSPRTADLFAHLACQAGLGDALRSVAAISLSAAADAPLARLALHRRRIAGQPDQAGMLAALDRLLAERQSR